VSPINGPVDQLPPVSLFVGTHELLLADARKFVVLCRRRGVRVDYHEYAKMNHDFPLFPIPEARKAQQEIVRIIRG
jgi:acetyl esterase/lipase